MAKNKKYIVTSIPYANAKPHMGHTLDPLYGDVLNRYFKNNGEESYLQIGIDENGQKILQKAESEGKKVEEWLTEIEPVFIDFAKKLNLDYQIYTKTADPKYHWPACQEMWRRAKERGDIYKKKYKGLYCVGCEAFLKEEDLIDGKCPDHQKVPELIEEENYFFALSKYQEFLKKYFDENPDFVQPKNYFNEAYNMIHNLEDVSISRPKKRLPWGVPVPDDSDHVIYVWFDALINYLSGIGFPSDMEKFSSFWPADVEIIGKDNNRWHSLLWPAMLKSAGLDIPKVILVHGYITAKGGVKMSKTIGNVVDPIEMLEKYGTDPFRYFLLSNIPLSTDGAFDEGQFREVYNSNLSNDLGNLLQRTLTMAQKYNFKPSNLSGKMGEDISAEIKKFRFDKALEKIWEIIRGCNGTIDREKPWELAKTDQKKLEEVLGYLLNQLSAVAVSLEPFMPETAEKMKSQLKTLKPEPLFPKLESKEE